MNKLVSYELSDKVATVTLNDPDRLNCFSAQLVNELHEALDKAIDDAHHLVFRAQGKGFSGGFDLSGIEQETDGDLLLRLVRIEQLLQRVRHYDGSTTALVHGACYGAAADLVLACRTRVATSTARFLMPGMKFGIVLGTRRLRDTLGEVNAYQLLDRRKPFDSDEALQTGFASAVVEQDQWQEFLIDHLDVLSQYTPRAYAQRMQQLTPDTRDSDMAALVGSVTDGSIQERLQAFVASMKC
ncbi:MAG: enoyl-CoA hydratase/isomerase family protein [Granulosicoccus sp.]|nr:enoyl-CoA hydratase/isomerase family protein [Granulosicoccus sp.]